MAKKKAKKTGGGKKTKADISPALEASHLTFQLQGTLGKE